VSKRTTSVAPAKRKRMVTAEDAAFSVGTHFTEVIPSQGAALLAQTLGHCNFVIKNHGPEGVKLVAQAGDVMDLPAGRVRATHAYGHIRVENDGEKPALIEFDFLPYSK